MDEFDNLFNDPDFDAARIKANIELMQLLGLLIVENPSQRFSQILLNYGFVTNTDLDRYSDVLRWKDEFHQEPQVILERVKKAMET